MKSACIWQHNCCIFKKVTFLSFILERKDCKYNKEYYLIIKSNSIKEANEITKEKKTMKTIETSRERTKN